MMGNVFSGSLPVEYNGIHYFLVQTIVPPGWRWSFTHLDHEFSDIHATRHEAILGAKRTIDNLISLQLTLNN